MGVSLAEVLTLPSFRAAGTEVLHGDPDRVPVRWVHSSEVFEMGSLLAGGEVLLTSGLGLHGRTAGHLASYVDQLADAGVKRIVFAGSSSVYGNSASLPKRETEPMKPLSPYALQKQIGEQ